MLTDEFNSIWEKAPKFPEIQSATDLEERIDVDSFVQIYRDIDDLFEEDEEDQLSNVAVIPVPSSLTPSKPDDDESSPVEGVTSINPMQVKDEGSIEDELEAIFYSMADKNKLIPKERLKGWDEVLKLFEDDLLAEDEFEALWDQTPKSPSDPEKIDVDGFFSFNVALDDLFDTDDDDDPIDNQQERSQSLIVEGDMSPDQLFSALAGMDGFVSRDDLSRWSELQDLLNDGELLVNELNEIYLTSALGKDKLDQSAFLKFYSSIDALFEPEDDGIVEKNLITAPTSLPITAVMSETKELLLRILEGMNDVDDTRLPCGLEASEREIASVLKLVNQLEREPTNRIMAKGGGVDAADLAGAWELLYSSSSAMKFNKGLTGLGGSVPSGKFGGLKQILKASKLLMDVEYVERVSVTPSAASFDVKVNGDWEIRRSTSLFTGEPSVILQVTPDRVSYGPTSTRADHWKSLGPMNILDVAYLDDDLRIMRGSTSVDTIFIFRRTKV